MANAMARKLGGLSVPLVRGGIKMVKTELQKVIELLKETDNNCKKATYSLDDVNRLGRAIEVLKREQRLIYECCY